ncbi:MAG: hypothetical protein CBB71_01155 [Rhodopirellula sp. TMED11]|nr:MAG: hypothetical protein CBB71_01155 [Rhodopirellula sp. TMED11]
MTAAPHELIDAALDGRISEADFARLQDAMLHDAELRLAYLRANNLHQAIREQAAFLSAASQSASDDNGSFLPTPALPPSATAIRWPVKLALVAGLAICIASLAYFAGWNASTSNQLTGNSTETLLSGHATLRRSLNINWTDQQSPFQDGQVLPQGKLQFAAGVAEIDFFCGASVVIEGPADLDIVSDWEVTLHTGRLRASVPPAARGFKVNAAETQIVDLGTEFAVEVSDRNADVQVIDGEIRIDGGQLDGTHLLTGQRRSLTHDQPTDSALESILTTKQLQLKYQDALASHWLRWQSATQGIAVRDDLIAYYPITSCIQGRTVQNVGPTGSLNDGQIVGPVQLDDGRYPALSSALDFSSPGSRVRTRIDGEFSAFSFTCWVNINRLDNLYNALFMADGYENGEPHWQIRNDGSLMFSVMVDDTQEIKVNTRFEDKPVTDAGLHRVYFTKPVWNDSMRDRWIHLAAVYDLDGRKVSQYVNGELVGEETIPQKFVPQTLRIGGAELGNWGQPFRNSPWFAVRNLNGKIDDMLLLDSALDAQAIRALYLLGKPLGYE